MATKHLGLVQSGTSAALTGLAAGDKYAKQMYYDEDLETFRHVESDGSTMADGFVTRINFAGDTGNQAKGQKSTVTFKGDNLLKTDASGSDFIVKIDDTNAGSNKVVGYDGTNVAWVDQLFQSIEDTDTVDLALDANGKLTAQAKLSATAGNAISNDSGLYVKQLSIDPASAAMLGLSGDNVLSVKQLLVTEPTVDETSVDLAAAIAANYANGNELQKGDTLIVVQADSAYMHNGGTNGDASDFVQIKVPIAEGGIRALFSASNGIAYNSATGAFTGVVNPSASNDLTVDSDGFFVEVAAADIVDTNDFTGSGAGSTVNLQALADAIQTKVGQKANDTGVLHIAGEETATGKKIMSAGFEVSGGTFTSSRDFEITDNTKGIIGADSSGARYRMTIAAPGVWVGTAL